MKNYVQDGEVVTLTAPYDTLSGAGALFGKIFGVAVSDVLSGASGEYRTEGVIALAKDTSVFSQGDPVYWDNTNKCASSTGQSNWLIGRCLVAALTGDATVTMLLNETGPSGIFASAEQTGTGSAQNVAHGLAVVPRAVIVWPTDTSPSTAGVFVVTLGTNTTTNVVVTVTSGKKFRVTAFA